MAEVVLYEFDIDYYSFMDDNPAVIAERLTSKFSPGTCMGDWLKEHEIKVKFTSMNSQLKSLCKYVAYADMTSQQQTLFTLKFL